jgi:hypothetical protein
VIPYQLVMPGILLLDMLLFRHRGGVLRHPVGMIGIHNRLVVLIEVPGYVNLECSLHK